VWEKEVVACWEKGSWLAVVHIDLSTKVVTPVPTAIPHQREWPGKVAFSADGRWLAATTDPAFRVTLYDLKTRKQGLTLGPNAQVPRVVAWAAKGHGIAWGYQAGADGSRKELAHGLDLNRLEALAKDQLSTAVFGDLPASWVLSTDRDGNLFLNRPG